MAEYSQRGKYSSSFILSVQRDLKEAGQTQTCVGDFSPCIVNYIWLGNVIKLLHFNNRVMNLKEAKKEENTISKYL